MTDPLESAATTATDSAATDAATTDSATRDSAVAEAAVGERRRFLSAEWRDLAMVNFAIDPAVLLPLVPRGTELDTWHGITYVSLVGFRFLRTRLLGVPIPGHRDFEEVNLRFYVRRRERHELRRGVVFVREIVPRRAIALVARAWYNEPYVALPMRHHITRTAPASAGAHAASGAIGASGAQHLSAAPAAVAYEWRHHAAWEGFALRVPDASSGASPADGSEEEYITEHYWGYTRQRDGGSVEYEVRHPRWRVWHATVERLTIDVAALYGPPFADALAQPPRSAFVADGSAITVHQPRTLPGE